MARILRAESSLARRQDDIERELSRAPRLLLAVWILAALAAAAAVAFALLRHSPLHLLWAAAALAAAAGFHLRQRELLDEARLLQGGRRGEAKTSAVLAERLADDHLILNDLDLRIAHERAQIDHLVLAPAGIWVIESKFWAGTLSGDVNDTQWTQTNHRRHRTVKSPVLQVRRQRSMLISEFNLRIPEDRIHALAVFTHPAVRLDIRNAGDSALLLKNACRLINDHCFDPPLLTPDELQTLANEILARQA